jgi:2-succinyl-6-hydroxy-2,4-cyclohexadiene-1-carboxylate synthase
VPEGQRAALREQRLCNSAAGLANSLRGVGTGAQPSLWQRLGELRLPVLLVAGALDAKFARIAAEMAEHLPGARLRVVPDAGHAVHFERPDAFDALVIAFCSSWPRHGVAAATKE